MANKDSLDFLRVVAIDECYTILLVYELIGVYGYIEGVEIVDLLGVDEVEVTLLLDFGVDLGDVGGFGGEGSLETGGFLEVGDVDALDTLCDDDVHLLPLLQVLAHLEISLQVYRHG